VTRRLSKRDVEALLTTYDADPVAALEQALRRMLDDGQASFDELIERLTQVGDLSPARRRALLERETAALDTLAAELNETRTLRS
jgi:hypothetical protein